MFRFSGKRLSLRVTRRKFSFLLPGCRFEIDREGKHGGYGLAVDCSGFPVGHSVDYPESLGVEGFVHTLADNGIGDFTVGIDGETYDYHIILAGSILHLAFREFYVLNHPLNESFLPSGELGDFFDRLVDLLSGGLNAGDKLQAFAPPLPI